MKKIYTPLFLIIVCFAPLFSTFAQSGRIPVSSEKGIVTSSHKLASQAGAHRPGRGRGATAPGRSQGLARGAHRSPRESDHRSPDTRRAGPT